ncbi:hypothetical protein BRADI_1g69822v3 [Brachypodium distachyon]|uniref:Uncharacterized protein n=1 Tax=Brachypodium distachyon TaxID=15368 RepID=A0A2K2DUB4_BRADI|nr:hypothetical protein BRADI_1g69822v3 [Brachypodium distachyon]
MDIEHNPSYWRRAHSASHQSLYPIYLTCLFFCFLTEAGASLINRLFGFLVRMRNTTPVAVDGPRSHHIGRSGCITWAPVLTGAPDGACMTIISSC